MKKLLTYLILLIGLFVSAQTPNISYTSQNVYLNSATTISPTNTGGIPTQRTRVSTLAGWQGGEFSSTYPNGFTWPIAVANAPDGSVYAMDDYWPCIRKVFPDGTTSVLAGKHITDMYPLEGGTIQMGYADGQGDNAEFSNPKGIVCDQFGNIYIADTGNHRIRKVTPSGLVTTVAGDGTNAELDGQGLNAQFSFPYAITIDSVGNLYVIDLPTFTLPQPSPTWPNTNTKAVIRKIDTLGNVTTLAGDRFAVTNGVDGIGTAASFKYSLDISCDSLGNVYIADTGNYKIRKIVPSTRLVSTIYYSAGISPSGIEIDSDNNIYFGDLYTSNIRRLNINGTSNWTPSTYYAGAGYSNTGPDNSINGLGNVAQFYEPHGIAIDSNKNLFIADHATQRIRKVVLLQPYTISPSLPTGLTFDPLTGIISGTPTSVSPSTQYTITASNYSGTSTTTVTLAVVTTSCGSSTTWNGSSWSNGFPNTTKTAIIAGNYNVNVSIDCCDLIVNSGATLTIRPNRYCNVLGDITVNGTFIVRADGKLIFSSTSISTGIVDIERDTTFMKQYDYTYWGSPVVTDIGLALLPTNWETNYTFFFNTANFYDIETSYYGTFISNSPDGQDDNGDAWTRNYLTGQMIPGKGYASMIKSIIPTGTYPRIETVTFTGELNTGQINIPLQLSQNTATDDDDFNLVGNPYPSAINSSDFIDANITNISGTLYFWTHSNTLTSTYSGLAQLNFSTNDYAKYTKLGGIAAVFGSKQPSNVIGSGQGFLVEAETNADAVFTPNLMSKAYDNTTDVSFFKTTNSVNTDTDKRVWISMKNEVGLYSQQLIGYNESTNLEYNKGWDSKIVNSRFVLKFYSKEANTKYDIQARGNFDINDVVKFGYNSQIVDTFTISLDSINGIDNVYIKDNGIIHDLPYTFTTEIGEFNDRFELVYLNTDLGIDPITDSNLVIIPNPAKNNVEILFKELNDTPIAMYNLLGQQIKIDFKIDNNNNKIIFNVENLCDGIYLIKINNTTLKLIKK